MLSTSDQETLMFEIGKFLRTPKDKDLELLNQQYKIITELTDSDIHAWIRGRNHLVKGFVESIAGQNINRLKQSMPYTKKLHNRTADILQ